MCITHGKTTHLVRLTKPKQAYLQSPARSGQPTHKSQQLENTWIGQLNFSNNWTAGAPSHQVPTCLIRSENRHVSTRGWILSPQAEIPSFLKWHKAEGHVTESSESFSQLSLLSPSTHSVKNLKLPWLGQWSVRDRAPGPLYECWAKPTWMGGVVLLPLKMEVRLVIFPPLD